jgi:hypothetical protein
VSRVLPGQPVLCLVADMLLGLPFLRHFLNAIGT